MKLKLISCALMALVVTFTACKKDDAIENPTTSQNNQLTAKVDGVSFQSKEVAAISHDGNVLVTAEDAQGNTVTISGPAEVGTFSSASGDATSGFYTGNNGNVWLSTFGGGAATITISKYDASAKKISGSFSFTALPSGGDATGTKTITNGSFTDVSFLVQ